MRLKKLCAGVVSATMLFMVNLAHAQTCTATSGSNADVLNVSGGASFTPKSYTVIARLGAAGKQAFGGARIAMLTRYSDNTNAFAFGADFGWSFPLGTMKNFVLCPLLDYSYQAGPNNNGPTQIIRLDSYHAAGPGASLGRVLRVNDDIAFLPYVGGIVQWIRYERREFGDRDRVYSHMTTARGGIGIEFKKNFVIKATVAKPFGVEAPPTSIGFSGTISFPNPHPDYRGAKR